MNNKKILSLPLSLYFIEKIVTKFRLEENFINSNIQLKKELDEIEKLDKMEDPNNLIDKMERRVALKFLLNNGQSFEPSKILRQIIEDLINNKIEYEDLPSLIEKNIKTSKEIAELISQDIKNNELVIKEKNIEIGDFSNDDNFYSNLELTQENKISPELKPKIKGINQDLM